MLHRRPRCAAHRRTRCNARARRGGRGRWASRWKKGVITMSRGRLLDRRPEPVRQSPSERKDVPATASIGSNDAPLIGERAATRGRVATEGGDEPPGEPNTIRPSAFSGLPLGQRGAPPRRHDELRWQSSTRHRWLRRGRWRQAQLNSTSKEPAKKSSPGGLAQVPPCVQKKKFG